MSKVVKKAVARAVAVALASSVVCGAALAAQEDDGGLPEVVVTAQFVATNMQDTPIAITAVTAEMLEARSQVNVEQITNQAPNVTLRAQGASMGPSLIGFIRGVGQTDFNPAMEPGVGLYVDDVYYSTLTGSVLDLLDLERVEILRGPQGTLAGKNSIGGSIKLFTRKPTGDGPAFAEVGYGSYKALSLRAATDITLVEDKLFGRVAGVARSRDGYVTQMDYGCSHPDSGVPVYTIRGANCVLGHEGGIQYVAGRGSLRWLASDSVEVNLSGDITNDRSETPANVLRAVGGTLFPVGIDTDNNPATGLVSAGFLDGVLPAIPTGYDVAWDTLGYTGSACRFIAYGPNSCDPQSPNNPYLNYSNFLDPRAPGTGGYAASAWTPLSLPREQTLSSYGLSANIDWQITDTLQLQSITAWRHFNASFNDDADGSPLPLQLMLQHLYHDQKSQELRLNGKAGSLLDWTVGGFYFDQLTQEDSRVSIPYAALDFLHGPDRVPASSWALFAHGIFHFTDKLDLALGVRYTEEKKDYTYARVNPDGTEVCTVGGLNCSLVGLDGGHDQFKGDNTDYRAALSYRFTDELMGYAQISTGFKGGGLNPRPYFPEQMLSFGAEKLDAYEIGAKTDLFGRTLRVNVALFYNEYNDIQLPLQDCTVLTGSAATGIPCLAPANVGSAEVKGGELEFNWLPGNGFEMDGSLSLLDFGYTRVADGTGIGLNNISPYTPKTKWSLGAQYTFDLSNGASIIPRLDASYQSTSFGNPTNTVASKIDSYTLLNGRITWRSPEDTWQVALEGQNLTDKLYYTTTFDLIDATGG
ncbi:MAG: TonB-dependent receptor, partial [Nevskiaceae bacterium]|nr:TonB-dependent receptor [Nevskiaceae bacterium]